MNYSRSKRVKSISEGKGLKYWRSERVLINDHVGDGPDKEAGFVEKSNDSSPGSLDQVTDDPVVEIVNLERGGGGGGRGNELCSPVTRELTS